MRASSRQPERLGADERRDDLLHEMTAMRSLSFQIRIRPYVPERETRVESAVQRARAHPARPYSVFSHVTSQLTLALHRTGPVHLFPRLTTYHNICTLTNSRVTTTFKEFAFRNARNALVSTGLDPSPPEVKFFLAYRLGRPYYCALGQPPSLHVAALEVPVPSPLDITHTAQATQAQPIGIATVAAGPTLD